MSIQMLLVIIAYVYKQNNILLISYQALFEMLKLLCISNFGGKIANFFKTS